MVSRHQHIRHGRCHGFQHVQELIPHRRIAHGIADVPKVHHRRRAPVGDFASQEARGVDTCSTVLMPGEGIVQGASAEVAKRKERERHVWSCSGWRAELVLLGLRLLIAKHIVHNGASWKRCHSGLMDVAQVSKPVRRGWSMAHVLALDGLRGSRRRVRVGTALLEAPARDGREGLIASRGPHEHKVALGRRREHSCLERCSWVAEGYCGGGSIGAAPREREGAVEDMEGDVRAHVDHLEAQLGPTRGKIRSILRQEGVLHRHDLVNVCVGR
mmetsp:Transcript_30501/g.99598  ORF Transcript_30501/g.99598 Transcript_30501/m.99598 type:complete len:272 (-) Transcript_30501:221-1036(-)